MIELNTEVVVVGSGFGGAVTAARLVDAGISVVMLERGPWRDTVPVNSMNVREHAALPRHSFSQLLRKGAMTICHHRWTPARGFGINRRHGTFEVNCQEGFVSAATSQVGGGSLIWAGLIDRPLDPNFWNDVAEGVSEATLAPHFTRITSELGTCSVVDHKINFPPSLYPKLQQNEQFDLSVNNEAVVAHRLCATDGNASPGYGIERRVSQRKENLIFGCLDGSKASTDAIYIGPALAKGLQLLAQCEVRSVQARAEGGYCILAHHSVSDD